MKKKSQYEEGIRANFGLVGEHEGAWSIVRVAVLGSNRVFFCIQRVPGGSLVGKCEGGRVRSK